MTDLSHRILKWNRVFYSKEWNNPYVDMVYLACDCAHLPLADNCIDIVFSNGGFESMQHKMMDGFYEGFRVLKSGAHAVYNISTIDDHNSENTKKWIQLFTNLDNSYRPEEENLYNINQWLLKCEKAGYGKNEAVKVYGELPAPTDDIFPFENEIFQWMAEYVIVSQK
jgi:ubiquinone/menaquinone biosynthesis C-methylase UbiE